MNLNRRGWARVPADAESLAWAEAALAEARPILAASEHAGWWRHGRTWFAGVGVLPNTEDGRVGGVEFPSGPARATAWAGPWDKGQISDTRPGNPGRDDDESDAAHRYRRVRDAAHVDGLLPVGPGRRRMAREYHAFILGIGLTEAEASAAPLVVWEGSHEIMRRAFARDLADVPVADWPDTDLTDTYHAARRTIFDTCARVPLSLAPGEVVVVHRLALHGVAPWAPGARAAAEGRAVAYFRPETDRAAWLADD